MIRGVSGDGPEGATADPARTKDARAGILFPLHCTRKDLAALFVCNFIRDEFLVELDAIAIA